MKKLSTLLVFLSLVVAFTSRAQTINVTTVDSVRMNNPATGITIDSGMRVQVTGIVYGPNGYPTPNGNVFMLRGATKSVKVYSKRRYGYSITDGDSVMVVGTVSDFNGQTEISPNSAAVGDTILLLRATGHIDTPTVVQLINESNEAQLIQVNNLNMNTVVNWTLPHTKHSFTAHVGSMYIFVDSFLSPDLWNGPAPTGLCNVVGFGSQYSTAATHNDGYSIQPRKRADFIQINVGVNEIESKLAAAIYPNPASTNLTVTFSYDKETSATVKMTDVTGRVVLSETDNVLNGDNTYKLNTSGLSNGLYILEVSTPEKSLIAKINISK